MKCTIISNGVHSLAITPETEIEKLQLQSIFKDIEKVDIQSHEKVQVLDKMLVDAIVISTSKKPAI